jgi:folate-binding protein YgfZ
MPIEWRALELDRWALLRIAGADTTRFLQGQLSNDVALLSKERSLLAGYHNPQGRVIALVRLLQRSEDELLALLPRELASTVSERLRRVVLRSKVRLVDVTAEWHVRGLIGSDAPAPHGLKLPHGAGAQKRDEDALWVCLGGAPPRWILLTSGASNPLVGIAAAEPGEWTRLDVASGVPQVFAHTSELFVAQMLNLDLIEAISFTKGCYTGQEVIARAHYRGRVKRRMQRWRTSAPARLEPGDAGRLADGRGFRVVEAAMLADGRCDFLAVAALEAAAAAESSPETEAAQGSPDSPAMISAEPMPLPYALPD